jgi:cytoskeletal protein CcmA (bactofilin family)
MTDARSGAMDDDGFDTILSRDIDFSGTLTFEKPFMIRGRVQGEILSEGVLVIDEEAVVEANITASRVIIRGSVTGNVTARERVELAVTGRLRGDLRAPEIFMDNGCIFDGHCSMTPGASVPRDARRGE